MKFIHLFCNLENLNCHSNIGFSQFIKNFTDILTVGNTQYKIQFSINLRLRVIQWKKVAEGSLKILHYIVVAGWSIAQCNFQNEK